MEQRYITINFNKDEREVFDEAQDIIKNILWKRGEFSDELKIVSDNGEELISFSELKEIHEVFSWFKMYNKWTGCRED